MLKAAGESPAGRHADPRRSAADARAGQPGYNARVTTISPGRARSASAARSRPKGEPLVATANPAMSEAAYRRAGLAAAPAQAMTIQGSVLKTPCSGSSWGRG